MFGKNLNIVSYRSHHQSDVFITGIKCLNLPAIDTVVGEFGSKPKVMTVHAPPLWILYGVTETHLRLMTPRLCKESLLLSAVLVISSDLFVLSSQTYLFSHIVFKTSEITFEIETAIVFLCHYKL